MDKIYSRRRIKLPQHNFFIHRKNAKKFYYFLTIWFVVLLTITLTINLIKTPFEKACVEETRKIGTIILNDISTQVLKNVNYDDLVIVSKDTNDKITMVKSNVILINILASDIAYKIQQKLSELNKEKIVIPMGILTGVKMLSATGPDIPIKVKPIGSVITNFRSEFEGKRNKPNYTQIVFRCRV